MAFEIRHTAMGSPWEVDIWDDQVPDSLTGEVTEFLDSFNATYSRFRDDSLIARLAARGGRVVVPPDFVLMMRMFFTLYEATGGKMNPLIGQSLSDAGYDKTYSLNPKEDIAQTPALPGVLKIIDDVTIELERPVLIDLGAIGKGYAVDKLVSLVQSHGLHSFVVNGSGDMRHVGGHPLKVGLEHPEDPTKVIGTVDLQNGSLASSGSNRRAWKTYHHIIDPETNSSPDYIRASWVRAQTATEADLIATSLFLVAPEILQQTYSFEYLLLNQELRIKKSDGWDGLLFS